MGKKLIGAMAVVTGALWLLGAPAPAVAQGHTWIGESLAQMIDTAGWRLGLLRVNAAFTLANAGYDTDIYFGFLEEPVPDWTLTAGLPVQVLVPLGKKVVLDLSDTPQYLFYLDTERERAWNNTFNGKLHFALDRVYVQAGGSMSDVRRRMSPELDINVREKRDGLDGLFLWQASRATSFAFLYGWDRYDYGDAEYLGVDLSQLLDRDEQAFDLIIYVQPSSRIRLSLDGRYGTYRFADEASSLRDARSYGAFGGIEFLPRAQDLGGGIVLRGRISLGYMLFDIIDPGLADGSGIAGEADVSADLTRRTSIRAFFSNGFQFSIYSGAAYYQSMRYGAGLSQRLSRRTTLSYDLLFGRTAYPEESGLQDLRDRYANHAFGLSFQLARHLEISLMGTLSRRTRGDADVPRDRDFFGLSLTYGHMPSGTAPPAAGTVR